jgi:signal transduction histidine kinase
VLARYEAAEPFIADADVARGIADLREQVDLAFLQEDILALMAESRDGIERVRKIVQDLKDFSRVDAHQQWQWADLHQGIDSTLNIVNNEVKYKADIVKEYGAIPEVECLPSQINQVIMNIVVNGAQAIEGRRGRITIRTGASGGNVWIEIADNGCGIPQAIQSRIFDPFFTTKPIGTGTGLGLSLSYGIIQKHRGRIDMQSEEGVGTTFRIELPIRQPDADDSTEKLA